MIIFTIAAFAFGCACAFTGGCVVLSYQHYAPLILRKLAESLAPHLPAPRPLIVDNRWKRKRRKHPKPSICSAETLEMPRVVVAEICR